MGKRRLGVKNELLDGIIEAGRRGDQGSLGCRPARWRRHRWKTVMGDTRSQKRAYFWVKQSQYVI